MAYENDPRIKVAMYRKRDGSGFHIKVLARPGLSLKEKSCDDVQVVMFTADVTWDQLMDLPKETQ